MGWAAPLTQLIVVGWAVPLTHSIVVGWAVLLMQLTILGWALPLKISKTWLMMTQGMMMPSLDQVLQYYTNLHTHASVKDHFSTITKLKHLSFLNNKQE